MHSEVSFYQVKSGLLLKVLPKLLEKVLQQGMRGFVWAEDEALCQKIDDSLWTYHPQSFLPHGTVEDSSASEQPILISTKQEQNKNNSNVFVSVQLEDIAGIETAIYKKIIYVFEEGETDSVEKMNQLATRFQAKACTVVCWQQNKQGAWEKFE